MLSINVFLGGESYHFATKQHSVASFKECLCDVGVGNTKLVTFYDENNKVNVSVSPLSSIITYKEL